MSKKQTTVRYNNKQWVVDKDTNMLSMQGNPKIKVDIDEVWEMLSDRDQNTIALILSSKTEEYLQEEDTEGDF